MKIANTKRCLPHALAALLLTAGGATEALAQSSTANVTGSITGTCRITGGAALTIPLGAVDASTFKAVGDFSGTAGMQNITLTCTASPGIQMTMTGTQNTGTANTSVLALTGSGAGIATGVGVQLLYSTATTGTPTTLLTRGTAVTIPTGATVTVRVGARYFATTAAPTAGAANSTATLTFTVN